MPGTRIAAALGNQIECGDPPSEETSRIEAVRVVPQARIVVLAVHVEEHQRTGRDLLPAERDVAGCA